MFFPDGRVTAASRPLAWLVACTALAGCAVPQQPRPLPPLPPLTNNGGQATPRINGDVTGNPPMPQVAVSAGPGVIVSASPGAAGGGGGSVTLDFADTDIREVVAQILGNTLHVNYAIDPPCTAPRRCARSRPCRTGS